MKNGNGEERKEIHHFIIEEYDPGNNVISTSETIESCSGDDTQETRITVTRYFQWACGHGKAYGYTCGNCGARWCSDCYRERRFRYCAACGVTLCPFCFNVEEGRHYCSEHNQFWRRIDWQSLHKELIGMIILSFLFIMLMKCT